ncbi:hypothetical protein TNIN_453531 [Trichonephila inaurata madagascariensis]|uniref:Uncharacterized protein n=1 Tax=Trichonephila inaurata madagascariensis TaxID=2747483 RepID=A0A8X7C186_9ARAC|nr:hypothetical protein TNIN_453531 [Trichonephila inaurata madagascariensis]
MELLSEETEQALIAIGVTSITLSTTSATFSYVNWFIAARMDCTRVGRRCWKSLSISSSETPWDSLRLLMTRNNLLDIDLLSDE